MAKFQATNDGEISAYGAIVDDTIVALWKTANGNYGQVVTPAEAICDALLAADAEGYTVNCQLHTHPGMTVFWSQEDQKQQVQMIEFVGPQTEFTFLCVDGFSWIARTCTGYTCIDRPVELDGVTLPGESNYAYGNWGYYDPLAPSALGASAYLGLEGSDDWHWEHWLNGNLDAPADGSQALNGLRQGRGEHRERRSEQLWAERSYTDQDGRFTSFTPYRDRRWDRDEE